MAKFVGASADKRMKNIYDKVLHCWEYATSKKLVQFMRNECQKQKFTDSKSFIQILDLRLMTLPLNSRPHATFASITPLIGVLCAFYMKIYFFPLEFLTSKEMYFNAWLHLYDFKLCFYSRQMIFK